MNFVRRLTSVRLAILRSDPKGERLPLRYSNVGSLALSLADASFNEIETRQSGDAFVVSISGTDDSITFENFSDENFLQVQFQEFDSTYRLYRDGRLERASDGIKSFHVEL